MENFFKRDLYLCRQCKRNIIQELTDIKRLVKNHWHFNYLSSYETITRIITYDQRFRECELAENIRKKENGVIPIKGFGSSDCKCSFHLIYLED